jgi:hypothetical protein
VEEKHKIKNIIKKCEILHKKLPKQIYPPGLILANSKVK